MLTTPEAKEFIDETKAKIFDDQSVINRIGQLQDRWQEEQAYEDFKDYQTAIKNMTFQDVRVSKAFKLVRSAFGATVTIKFNTNGGVKYSVDAPSVEFRG